MNPRIMAVLIFTVLFMVGFTHSIKADVKQINPCSCNTISDSSILQQPPATICEYVQEGIAEFESPEYQLSIVIGSGSGGLQSFKAWYLTEQEYQRILQLEAWCNGEPQPDFVDPDLLPVYICSAGCLFNALLLTGIVSSTAMSIVGLTTMYALIGIAYPIALAMAGLMSGTLFAQGLLCYGLCFSQFGT